MNNGKQNVRGVVLPENRFAKMSRNPPMYTDEDWDLNNKIKMDLSDAQQKLAERILDDSRKVVDQTIETAKSWKCDVDHSIKERMNEINFLAGELNKQKKDCLLEVEALEVYIKRIEAANVYLRETSLAICLKCLTLREGRIGVDLVEDEVDRQLHQELKAVKGSQALMGKIGGEAREQLRKLRAAMYLLDNDLEFKDTSLRIDENNLSLRPNSLQLSKSPAVDPSRLHICAYTITEWEQKTHHNIEQNARELNTAAQFRIYVDLLLKQFIEDMETQTMVTNNAFDIRIAETKHIKGVMEKKHHDTMNHINEINMNIVKLNKEIRDTEGYLKLCQTRLNNRASRPGLELTCDKVQDALYKELSGLQDSIQKLHQKINENKASLRYLLHTQIMQEEEINIKANTLKIDEVDCAVMRKALRYSSF